MGRAPCCEKVGLKRGRWTTEEDDILTKYIQTHGEGSWRSLPKNAGLLRCGKSCRLRWINYLRSDLRRGNISSEEEETIIKLHASLGNRWSLIATHLPGRTDNEIKNYWNSHLCKKIDSINIQSSNLDQEPEQMDHAVDLPKPKKSKTGRPSLKKKNKPSNIVSTTISNPPPLPNSLEVIANESVSTTEPENGNGQVSLMPATPIMEEETLNIGSMLLEYYNEEDKEIMDDVCLDSSCFNDIVLGNIDGSLDDFEVDPNGVQTSVVSSGPIVEESSSLMLMSDNHLEDLLEVNGEWQSCNSSTNSCNVNEEEKFGWDYWNMDDGLVNGQELWDSNIEEDEMLSWLWDNTN